MPEWAAALHEWAMSIGLQDSVTSIEEIMEGEDSHGTGVRHACSLLTLMASLTSVFAVAAALKAITEREKGRETNCKYFGQPTRLIAHATVAMNICYMLFNQSDSDNRFSCTLLEHPMYHACISFIHSNAC